MTSAPARVAPQRDHGVDLRYIARAGLLPELTRQTYDSFDKALREAILNSFDADASHVEIDFSRLRDHHEITISDDGSGMTLGELQESFLALGGSAKLEDARKFGRIGIGSLAVLHYAEEATLTTKIAGVADCLSAVITHPWELHADQRRNEIGALRAGTARVLSYAGSPSDHFTHVRLMGVKMDVLEECLDPSRYYRLLDRLRVLLPVPWSDGPLRAAVSHVAPDVFDAIDSHCREFSVHVGVKSEWGALPALTRRAFGDLEGTETWDGPPAAFVEQVPARDGPNEHEIVIAGYLLNQTRALPGWAGVTARVQNVAVEERTFFGMTDDPGFRKYITGELFVLSGVDRTRLININRTSFNAEAPDYLAIARSMQNRITHFKSERVQQPRRRKAQIRRLVDAHVDAVLVLQKLGTAASTLLNDSHLHDVPSSGLGTFKINRERDLPSTLSDSGVTVLTDRSLERRPGDVAATLDVDSNGALVVRLTPALATPALMIGTNAYPIRFVEARQCDPPLAFRRRPRQLLVNIAHAMYGDVVSSHAIGTAALLELAYLLGAARRDEDIYDRALALLTQAS